MSIGMATGLLLTLRHIGGIEGTTPLMLGLLLLATVAITTAGIKNNDRIKVNFWLAGFLVACALSLLISEPVPLGYCWLRLAGFAVALAALSPLMDSQLFRIFRQGVWRGWWTGASLLTALSFLVLTFSIITSRVQDYQHFGFRGIMSLGMALSPIAALTAIYALWRYFSRAQSLIHCLAWLLFYAAATVTAIAAGSRIAVVGLIAASVVIIALALRKSKARVLLVSAIIISIGALSLFSPQINDTISMKMSYAAEARTPFSSRLDKWEGRLAEFESSPLTGIGFSAQTISSSRHDIPELYLAGQSPEPGSSWLSLLAQTGLLGTALFVISQIVSYRSVRRSSGLQGAVLGFLLLNGLCEGWLLYSSALLFPLFWMLPKAPESINADSL